MIPDIKGAVRSYLLADEEVSGLVDGRIWVRELHRNESELMPRSNIVIVSTGGLAQPGTIRLGTYRLDIRSYASTPYGADRIARAVIESMQHRLSRTVQGETLLHSATLESGILDLREPEPLNWPFTLTVWMVKSAHIGVA